MSCHDDVRATVIVDRLRAVFVFGFKMWVLGSICHGTIDSLLACVAAKQLTDGVGA